jgi:putative membrane protein
MNILRGFITGFLIGLANLIPGVSGGTFALILGIYERLISFLNSITPRTVYELIQLAFLWLKSGFKKTHGRELRNYLEARDYPFMSIIASGALVCIVAMSTVMKYLLLHHFIYTYSYFFGLIVLSVVIPWRMIKVPTPLLLLPLIAGILLTIGVTASVNPYEKSLGKSQLLQQEYQTQQLSENHSDKNSAVQLQKFAYTGKYNSGEYLYIFICGVIAISAMVLPGVSGSLVLILMNQYFAVISAIANIRNLLLDDLLFLSAMALGIIVGLLSFSRVIEYALRKFHDIMVAFLVGLIGGSLYSLWPFKQAEVIPEYFVKEGAFIQLIENFTVYSNVNILPADLHTTMTAVAVVVAGMVTMLFFVRKEK